MNTVVLLATFFILLLFSVPIAISMALASFIGIFVLDIAPLTVVGQVAFNSVFSFTLLSIPFYVLAGNIMSEGDISAKLCNVFRPLFGRTTGGLAMVSVASSTFFGAISGSSVATTAAIGSMMVPEMEKAGYAKPYALSVAAAGGVIGPIIPPSIGFILYGVATNTSISDLFIAGIFPGILFAICLCATIYITSRRRGFKGDGSKFSGKVFLRAIWQAKWAIIMPIIILGGIYGGIFTPTEAGAVACIYGLLITLVVERTMTGKQLLKILKDSVMTSASILFVVGCAGILSKVFTLAQVPQQVASGIMALAHSKFAALTLINILLLFLGCVMDGTANIIIMSPILLPVALAFGIDPVHFGMILCINVGVGAITPPVGSCLFTASIIGNTAIEKICKEIWPFIVAEVSGLLVINVFPVLSTGLLSVFGG